MIIKKNNDVSINGFVYDKKNDTYYSTEGSLNKEQNIKPIVKTWLITFFSRAFDYKGVTTKSDFFKSLLFYWGIFILIMIEIYAINCDYLLDKVNFYNLFNSYNRKYMDLRAEAGVYIGITSLFVMIPSISLIWRRFNDMNINRQKMFKNLADALKNRYPTLIFIVLFFTLTYLICNMSFYWMLEDLQQCSFICGILLVLFCSLLPAEKRGNLLDKKTLIFLSVCVYIIWTQAISKDGLHYSGLTTFMPLIMFGIICALCSGPSNYDNNPHYEYEKKRLKEIESCQKEAEQEAIKANEYNESIKASVGLDNLEKAAKLYKQKLITKSEFEKIKKQCLSQHGD